MARYKPQGLNWGQTQCCSLKQICYILENHHFRQRSSPWQAKQQPCNLAFALLIT